MSNCPILHDGVKLSQVSNCPRCQIVLLAWSVSNCPRCQIVRGVKLSHHPLVSLSLVPPALQLDQGPGQLLTQPPLPLGQAGLKDAVHRDVLSAQLHLQVKSNLQGVP